MKAEPTATLLSEMEGIPGIWDDVRKCKGLRIQRNKIHEYASDDFYECYNMWSDWKMFGFAESGGTNNQGGLYMDILRIMQACDMEYKVE